MSPGVVFGALFACGVILAVVLFVMTRPRRPRRQRVIMSRRRRRPDRR